MDQYFCPECGYEGDEPLCPHCNIAAERLDVSEEEVNDQATYSQETMKKVEGEEVEILDEEGLTGKKTPCTRRNG